jgi:hypothetical protein
MNGTFDQQDRQALETSKPIFRWVAAHEQYYVGKPVPPVCCCWVSHLVLGGAYSTRTLPGIVPPVD